MTGVKSFHPDMDHPGVGHDRGGEDAVLVGQFTGIRQLVVKSTGAGIWSNSFCWFCHAVPKFLSDGDTS